jgi:glutaredoxin 2
MSSLEPDENDTATHRQTIEDMSDDELDALLDILRKRRLRAASQHQQTLAARKAVRDEKSRARMERALTALQKKIDRVEAALDAIDKDIVKIRVLRLELTGSVEIDGKVYGQ